MDTIYNVILDKSEELKYSGFSVFQSTVAHWN